MDTVFGRLVRGAGIGRLRAFAPLVVLIVLCILIAIANPNFIEVRNLVRLILIHGQQPLIELRLRSQLRLIAQQNMQKRHLRQVAAKNNQANR